MFLEVGLGERVGRGVGAGCFCAIALHAICGALKLNWITKIELRLSNASRWSFLSRFLRFLNAVLICRIQSVFANSSFGIIKMNRQERENTPSSGMRFSGIRGSFFLFFGVWCALCTLNLSAAERFAFEKAEMGVPFRVTLYAQDEIAAKNAADAAFSRVEALNAIFSDYDSDSELSRLSDSCAQGRPVAVSPELWRVLEFAQNMAARSSGAFDMTVGPLVNLWRNARRKKEMPRPEKITEALTRTGYAAVRLDSEARTVELLKPKMRLDAGGIAKGYAAEEALKVLQQQGYSQALVSAGGDMAVGAPPPEATGWRIEITALDAAGAPGPRFLRLAHCFVSTSGDLYQRLELGGKRYSHIVDPRTGIGLTDHSLVTVIAGSGMEADVLAKVVSVLGPEAGMALVEETQGAAAHVVRMPEGAVEEKFSTRWEHFERAGSGER